MSAFNHRNFRLFFGGQLVSLTGTWMQQVAQAWLILQLTNDPLALGIVAAAQFGPTLVLGLFAGLLADAVSKRLALLWTNSLPGVLALALGLLVASGEVQPWHVYVLAFCLGIVNAFEMPLRQAFVVELVGRPDVANAVALNSAVFNLTRILGPAVAGVLIAIIGLAPLFLLNAFSYLAVLASLLMMRSQDLAAPSERAVVERHWRSVVDRLAEGLRYVRADHRILLPILVLAVVSTFTLNFQVLIPVYARDVLLGDADTFGFLMAASGVGSLSGAMMIAFGVRPTMRLLISGVVVLGLAMTALGLTAWLPVGLVLMFASGWGVIALAATTNTTIQLSVPDVLRGRVMSVYTTVFAGSVPFGGLFSGAVAGSFGVSVALTVGGLIALGTAAVAAASWRRSPARAAPN
ncbi:MAG TPA: MFS transporter [Candidatus Limnocylindrales bacterium]|nr:MFS transporter [Candidatus Limnocylindrales bacterium]